MQEDVRRDATPDLRVRIPGRDSAARTRRRLALLCTRFLRVAPLRARATRNRTTPRHVVSKSWAWHAVSLAGDRGRNSPGKERER